MNDALKLLLSLSLSGTLLMLLIFLAKPLYRNRLSRRWQYYIWLIVALRFVLPFSSEHTFSNLLFEKAEPFFAAGADIIPGINNTAGTDTAHRPEQNSAVSLNRHASGRSIFIPATLQPQNTADSSRFSAVPTCIFSLWLAVALILLIRKITIYRNFLHSVKATGTQVSNAKILNLLDDCVKRQRICRKVALYTSSLISSPVLTGIFHPAILLPVRNQDTGDAAYQEQLACIFAHELVHCRRQDMLYKWFIQLVLCVHWFNPLMRLLEKETEKACELACDEAVIQSLDENGRRTYGNTLLVFLRTDNLCGSSLASVPLKEDVEDLKERLGAIMKFRKNTKIMTMFTLLATFAIGIAFGALGAYAKSDTTEPSVTAGPANAGAQTQFLYPWTEENEPTNNAPSNENFSTENSIFCEFDKDVFYIYTDGATQENKPIVSFTDGALGVILVRKDSYAALGPFAVTEADDFTEDITELCEKMTELGSLTEKEADCILVLAEEIKENFLYPEQTGVNTDSKYTYVHRSYYQDSYIIGIGWNLSNDTWPNYQAKQVEITLTDGTSLNLYFSEDTEKYTDNPDVLAAAVKLISALRENVPDSYPALEAPLITGIRQEGADSPAALAEKAMESGDLIGFSELFPTLEYADRERFCELLYGDDNIAAFTGIIPFLEEELFLRFLDRAAADGKSDFLSALMNAGNFPESRTESVF